MSTDPQELRIAELERLLAIALAENRRLAGEIAQLKEKQGKSSRNSSKPPSSDPAWRPKRNAARPKKPTGRKRGAQKGHKKNERALAPQEQVDHHHDCIPDECSGCGEELTGIDPAPHLHQVVELPRVEPIIHQFAQHRLQCDCCGQQNRAPLPHGVPSRAFGPSVDAVVGVLLGAYRLSKRNVQFVLSDLFGLKMSLGAVIGCQQAASEALATSYDAAVEYARKQPVKNADETSWRQESKLCWLWTMVTPMITVFMIHARRNASAARKLLGEATGVLGTDRHGAYRWWPIELWQVCWAHLIRDFIAISERDAHSKRLGEALLLESKQLFKWHDRVRDGTMKRETFRRYVAPLKERVSRILHEGRDHCRNKKTAGTCRAMLKVFSAFWTFVDHEGVDPTNNVSEQRVRHGVIMRKISLGTQSDHGSRFVERILTVHATLRSQRRNVLQFVHAACKAKLQAHPPPSLLPTGTIKS